MDKVYKIKCQCGEPTGVRSSSPATWAQCTRCEQLTEERATQQANPDDFPKSREW